MLADGASVANVCHKPAIRLTIKPDMALAEKLNPARDEWQQIYQLLKAQKKRHPEGWRCACFSQVLVAGARNRRYLHLDFACV